MSEFDLVIRGAMVVTAADGVRCDVGVRGGRVAALGERLGEGAQEIDGTGRYLLPGLNDAHVHWPPAALPSQARLFALLPLRHGVTGVRSLGAAFEAAAGVLFLRLTARGAAAAGSACGDCFFLQVLSSPSRERETATS